MLELMLESDLEWRLEGECKNSKITSSCWRVSVEARRQFVVVGGAFEN